MAALIIRRIWVRTLRSKLSWEVISATRSMLLCLSMARMMFWFFFFRGSGNVALAGAAGCGHDREGPLRGEGRPFFGHAGGGGAGGGRQIVRRPAPGCGSRLEGQAAPGVRQDQSAGPRRWG